VRPAAASEPGSFRCSASLKTQRTTPSIHAAARSPAQKPAAPLRGLTDRRHRHPSRGPGHRPSHGGAGVAPATSTWFTALACARSPPARVVWRSDLNLQQGRPLPESPSFRPPTRQLPALAPSLPTVTGQNRDRPNGPDAQPRQRAADRPDRSVEKVDHGGHLRNPRSGPAGRAPNSNGLRAAHREGIAEPVGGAAAAAAVARRRTQPQRSPPANVPCDADGKLRPAKIAANRGRQGPRSDEPSGGERSVPCARSKR